MNNNTTTTHTDKEMMAMLITIISGTVAFTIAAINMLLVENPSIYL